MQKQSNNVVFGQNLALLTAAAELGTEVIARVIGSDTTASTLDGENLTIADIKSAMTARLLKYLNR